MPVYQLSRELAFPHPSLAREDGLLAVGGNLSTNRLILAYSNGIFPWFSEGEPILWWSPDPRCILYPKGVTIHTSMKKFLRKNLYTVTFDKCFGAVMRMCQKLRQDHTWITEGMIRAYTRLHEIGLAHSVEVWSEQQLVGGLYGVSLGRCFFGESMFSTKDNASKTALIRLSEVLDAKDFVMLDCQVDNPHLQSLGAENIPRQHFLALLEEGLKFNTLQGSWSEIRGAK